MSQNNPSFQEIGPSTGPSQRDSNSGALRLEFVEYNGMMELAKYTTDMDNYLQHRKGWVGMVIQGGVAKTIPLDDVVAYIKNGGLRTGKTFALVKKSKAEHYRSQIKLNLTGNRQEVEDSTSRKRHKI